MNTTSINEKNTMFKKKTFYNPCISFDLLLVSIKYIKEILRYGYKILLNFLSFVRLDNLRPKNGSAWLRAKKIIIFIGFFNFALSWIELLNHFKSKSIIAI